MKKSFVPALLAFFLLAGAASAQSTTFAQFLNLSGGKPFEFTNNGGSFSGTADTNVVFGFSNDNPFLVDSSLEGETVDAELSMSLTTSTFGTSNGTVVQTIDSGTITFTATEATGPIAIGDTLLSVSFTGGILTGDKGTSSPGLVSVGSSVTYSSDPDIFDFTDVALENFALSFSGSSTPFELAGSSGSSFLKSFNANGSGTFAAAVPEPATIAMVGAGLLGVPVLMLRRRRKA